MPQLDNTRHEKYCQHRVEGASIDDAYQMAGFKPNRSNAARLNANERIQARIAQLMEAGVKKAELSVERVLEELTSLAFYDLTEVIDSVDGVTTMKNPTSLPDELRRSIVSIKPVEIGGNRQYEYKFADKQKALESLARHLQMFKDTIVVENVFRTVRDMDDEELNKRIGELERVIADGGTFH